MNETSEPGQLLLQLLDLLGWEVRVNHGDTVVVTASRPGDALSVEAAGRTLADASFDAYERACRALVLRRGVRLARAA